MSRNATPSAPLIHLSADYIRAKEYLEAIVTSTSDAICTTDVLGKIIYFSPGAELMTGVPSAQAIGRFAHDLYVGGKDEAAKVMRLLRRNGSVRDHETTLKGPDGRAIHVSMSVSLLRDRAGRVIGTLGISKDISRHVELEKKLRALSITDNLTGLYNQRHFKERLGQEISRAVRQGNTLSLILIDLDGFKAINDKHGHLEGNRILKVFGDIITKCIRCEVDSAYRYGGDEFMLLLPATASRRAQTVASRITKCAAQLLGKEGLKFSYGIAGSPPSTSADQLLRCADERMYRMKARGRAKPPA